MEHSSASIFSRERPEDEINEGVSEFTADREADERSVLDDTEQLKFIGVVAEEVKRRLSLPQDVKTLRNLLANTWWYEGGEDCLGTRYRRLCCEGTNLRSDLYAQFQLFPNHRERAELIAQTMHFASFARFFEEYFPAIRAALSVEKVINTTREGANGKAGQLKKA